MNWRGLPLLAIAWVSYLLFARSMLYFIGFVSNVWVPQRIDGPRAASGPSAWLIDAALLLAFVTHHSLLARPFAKHWVTRCIPERLERSVYVAASSLLLILLMWQWRPLPEPVWHLEAPWARWALWALSAAGWLLALASSFRLGHSETFGVRPVLRWVQGRAFRPRGVERRTMYAVIRHPMYAGFLLGIWSTPRMSRGHLLLAIVLTAYIVIGRRWEERDLLRRLGAQYERYRQSVPAFVPRRRGDSAAARVEGGPTE